MKSGAPGLHSVPAGSPEASDHDPPHCTSYLPAGVSAQAAGGAAHQSAARAATAAAGSTPLSSAAGIMSSATATGSTGMHTTTQTSYQGPTARKYFKYHMQRLQTAASHILFYVVDAIGQATLAVVGTDVRGTGHFVYSSLPDFAEAVPLRCTNRIKVMEYLSALGASDAADPDTVQVSSITPEQLEMLLTSDPMYSRPALDRRYTSWREEGGKFQDGRHYKQFIVVDDETGVERVVVTAEDSHRRDRRYTYTAVPELGGFKLENGNAVKEWLDLMVGRSGPGNGAGALRSMSQPSFMTTPSAMAVHAQEPPSQAQASAAAAAAAAVAAVVAAVGGTQPGGSMATRSQPCVPGKSSDFMSPMHQQAVVRAVQAANARHMCSLDSGHTFRQVTPSDAGHGSEQSLGDLFTNSGAALGSASAWDALHEAHSGHSLHAALLDANSPPAKQSEGDLLTNRVHAHMASHTDSTLVADAVQLSQQEGGATGAAEQGQAGDQPLTGQEVLDAFQDVPELLAWVAGVPDVETVQKFLTFAQRLGAGSCEVPASELKDILKDLEETTVNLRLLEATQMGRAVSQLRSHPHEEVAQSAKHLTSTWRAAAMAALQHALQARP